MIIEPRSLRGFRDFLPAEESQKQQLVHTLKTCFASFGFVPIDTPILERSEVLLGKGGGETEKQVYRFQDHGNRDVCMRFDLTVPFARYIAAHKHKLHFPFKRFHIGKVFRGENTQKGRYREFTQCDFDIVGSSSISADIEIILLIHASLHAIGVKPHIHVFSRAIFNRFLSKYHLEEKSAEILRQTDKLRRDGKTSVQQRLQDITNAKTAEAIIHFITLRHEAAMILDEIDTIIGEPTEETKYFRLLFSALQTMHCTDEVIIDTSITRGLDYYTGIVFETFIPNSEHIGSVCSGGRYDDLASLYSKSPLPGVGASIGLDRLMTVLPDLAAPPPAADVLIALQDEALTPYYHTLAAKLREQHVSVDVFPNTKKLAQQFSFAEQKHIPAVIICGQNEYAAKTLNLRILSPKKKYEGISIERAVQILRSLHLF